MDINQVIKKIEKPTQKSKKTYTKKVKRFEWMAEEYGKTNNELIKQDLDILGEKINDLIPVLRKEIPNIASKEICRGF